MLSDSEVRIFRYVNFETNSYIAVKRDKENIYEIYYLIDGMFARLEYNVVTEDIRMIDGTAETKAT